MDACRNRESSSFAFYWDAQSLSHHMPTPLQSPSTRTHTVTHRPTQPSFMRAHTCTQTHLCAHVHAQPYMYSYKERTQSIPLMVPTQTLAQTLVHKHTTWSRGSSAAKIFTTTSVASLAVTVETSGGAVWIQ